MSGSKQPEVLKRILIIPDTHAPYHDKKAWELVMKVAHAIKWDKILVLGDFFDCYAISSYRKDPRREASLQKELNDAMVLMAELSSVPCDERVFWEGNHEWRLPRYLSDHAPELYELLMKDGDPFGLRAGGWKVVPYMRDRRVGQINVTHDLGRAGANALRYAMHDYMDNVIIGHTHMMQFYIEGNAKGIPHVGASFGWLGDINRIDYKHQMKSRKDFVLGFGYAHLRPYNNCVYIHPTPIVKYSCIVEGQLFTL